MRSASRSLTLGETLRQESQLAKAPTSLSPAGPAPREAASCERSHQQEDQDDHSDDKGDDGNRASVHGPSPGVEAELSARPAIVGTLATWPDGAGLHRPRQPDGAAGRSAIVRGMKLLPEGAGGVRRRA